MSDSLEKRSNDVEIQPLFGYVVERVTPDRPTPPPPMSAKEVKQLIALAMAADNRVSVGEATVRLWAEVAKRGRWTFAEAQDVMLDFYTNRPGEYLTPAHITEGIRQKRNDAYERKAAAEARVVDQASADQIKAICDQFAARKGMDAR